MRSGDGWLTPEALRDGLSEEYAVEKGDDIHTVVLGYTNLSPGWQWQVKRSVVTRRDGRVGVVESHSWYFEKLKDARAQWKAQVQRTAP